jgi:stress responsive alpha/beta barrel protein
VIRHVVVFRWKSGTTPAQLDALERALAEMPKRVSQIRRYRFGRDAGLAQGNFDFAVVADFDDADGWRAYWADAFHQRLIAEHVRPIAAERAALQFPLERE